MTPARRMLRPRRRFRATFRGHPRRRAPARPSSRREEGPMSFESDWRAWHDERERVAGADYGPSALESTNWLISEPAAVENVPGLWAVGAEGEIRGTELGVAGATVTLRRGEALRF